MKNVIPLLFVLLFINGKTQDNILKKIENDTILVVIDTMEGVHVGFGRYVDHKLEGFWCFYDRKKNPVHTANYVNGQLDGILLSYYKTGIIKSSRQFKMGKETGLNTWFYENGKLQLTEEMQDGFNNGYITEYHKNGQIRGKYLVFGEKNQDSLVLFNSTGKKNYEVYYDKNGIIQGNELFYDSAGFLLSNYFYIDGTVQEITYYFRNKTIYYHSILKNNQLNGPFYVNYENGKIKTEGEYDLDQYTGTWNYYDEKGKIITTTTYTSDDGISKEFDENGNLTASGNVYLEIKIDEWKYYSKKGKVTSTQQFLSKDEVIKLLDSSPNDINLAHIKSTR